MATRRGVVVVVVLASGLSLAAEQAQPPTETSDLSMGRSLQSGVYSDAQAQRGEPLYAEDCAYCHGAELEGTISAPPLTAAALSARWHDKTLADLFEYQQVFMPMNSPRRLRPLAERRYPRLHLEEGWLPGRNRAPLAARCATADTHPCCPPLSNADDRAHVATPWHAEERTSPHAE